MICKYLFDLLYYYDIIRNFSYFDVLYLICKRYTLVNPLDIMYILCNVYTNIHTYNTPEIIIHNTLHIAGVTPFHFRRLYFKTNRRSNHYARQINFHDWIKKTFELCPMSKFDVIL